MEEIAMQLFRDLVHSSFNFMPLILYESKEKSDLNLQFI